jgi:ferredoxin-NADP reductase
VTGWRPATVAEVRPESATARTLVLDVPGWPGHEAGQHVDVRLTADDGYTATRSYSIASVAAGERVEITVERLDDGEVSPYLVDVAQPGDSVGFRGPVGGWFVWRPTQPGPVLLLGGGSGVVPLMAMVRAHRQAGSDVPVRLVQSVRTPQAVLYGDELAVLAAQPEAHLDLTYVYTRRAPEGSTRPPGRLDAGLLAQIVFPAEASATAYVCGPTGFVEAVADLLVLAGYDQRRVRTERFGPSGGGR